MKKFIELSKILTKHRLKKIDMLSANAGSKNKYFDVTHALSLEKVTNFSDMARLADMNERSNNFHVFKKRLFAKFLNSLLFLDLDERKFNPYLKAISDCNRNLHCIIVLLFLSARESSTFIALKTLNKALKFELADVVLFCARHLRTHYSLIGNKKKFIYYNRLVKQYHEILNAEDSAAGYLETIYVDGVNFNAYKSQYVSTSIECLNNVEILFKTYPTYQICLNYYRIKGKSEFLQKNYTAAILSWKEFDALIDKYKHFEYNIRIAESELNKMDCYLHARNFKDGKACAQNCDKLFRPFSNNWFIFKESYLLLAFHTSKFQEAAGTINEVMTHNHFKSTAINRQEKWKIFEAYLYLLYKSGWAKGINFDKRSERFQISKFMNSIPTYSKDKRGYNVSVLIVHIMYLLIERNFTSLIDKIDSLKRYMLRYIDPKTESRAFVFLKMLVAVHSSNFSLNKTLQKTKLLSSKLSAFQLTFVGGSEAIEVVPYTDLWGIVLGCLD